MGGAPSGTALPVEQAQGLALVLLNVHVQGSNILMVLFGCHVILVGAPIFRSTFLPRWLGVWLAIAGVGYLINSFANLLVSQFAAHLLPSILIPGAVEIILALWLLVCGVNVERWKGQASAAEGRP